MGPNYLLILVNMGHMIEQVESLQPKSQFSQALWSYSFWKWKFKAFFINHVINKSYDWKDPPTLYHSPIKFKIRL